MMQNKLQKYVEKQVLPDFSCSADAGEPRPSVHLQ